MNPDLVKLLDRLDLLHEKATQAPWHVADRGIGWEVHLCAQPEKLCWDPHTPSCPDLIDGFRETMSAENAQLLAELRNAYPAIASALRAQQAVVDAVTAWAETLSRDPSAKDLAKQAKAAQAIFTALRALRSTQTEETKT